MPQKGDHQLDLVVAMRVTQAQSSRPSLGGGGAVAPGAPAAWGSG